MADEDDKSSDDVIVSEDDAKAKAKDDNSPVGRMLAVLERLETVLLAENEALQNIAEHNWPTMNVRKERCLLELTRGMGQLPKLQSGDKRLRERLDVLAPVLSRNKILLTNQLEAAKEISKTIVDAISKAESDGTYDEYVALDQGQAR